MINCQMINGDSTMMIEHINANVQTWIIDPPYNIGFKYNKHNDSMDQEDYNYFNHKIAKEMFKKTDDKGSMFYINYPEICAKQLIEIEKAGWKLNQWLTWVYPCNFGFSDKRFTRGSRAVLWFVKSEDYYFNHTVKGQYKDPNDTTPMNCGASNWNEKPIMEHQNISEAIPLIRQLEHFSDVIKGKATPIVDAKSARETLAVILQIEQATMPQTNFE